ncbi:unnamed protein product [Sphenostylis stenocarpa]|uniref:Uncharacterized protein n=1 Tax=Sphenostylis stenocarpa TaxID=92480 RepID=A0AA86VIU7_9FABA|nr:unnamed protein product [Sphenostylis stenocarpa]
MTQQDHKLGRTVPDDEVNDEIRLYRCARKYETIVKQFDELVEIMNNTTTIPKTRRKSRRGGASGGKASGSSNQLNRNEVIVQTVTRFLHELRTNPTDSDKEAHET